MNEVKAKGTLNDTLKLIRRVNKENSKELEALLESLEDTNQSANTLPIQKQHLISPLSSLLSNHNPRF